MAESTVMILAGGTGGHVFPGLAVASELQRQGRAVIWMGTRRGIEATLVPAAGIPVEWITIAGIRGRGLTNWLAAPVRLVRALTQALSILIRVRPVAVLGMGGFVSGPGGVAAWLTRRPLIIHEQNSVAGTTNRLLARLAARVFEAFPNSFPDSIGAVQVGNPVRAALTRLEDPLVRLATRGSKARRRLLILGGSQGARSLNETVPAALALLPAADRPEIWHQAGGSAPQVVAAYERAGVEARVTEFIEDMAEAYSWADLAVCRAGALTLAELAAVGLGAILVPYPHAIDDHQHKNAEYFVARGAAELMPEAQLSPQSLATQLGELLPQLDRLLELARVSRALDYPAAAAQVAGACLELGR